MNENELLKLANKTMPYGKHKGTRLIDLPEHYVVWYYGQGLPNTEIGKLLKLLYEIKVNGLEYLVHPLKN